MLTVGIDLLSSHKAQNLARSNIGIYYSAGLHPNAADRLADEWQGLKTLAGQEDCLAVGETGVDKYWDKVPLELQTESFRQHLRLANELDKPVIIHCRDAFPETLSTLTAEDKVAGVLHCFSAGIEEARQVLDRGLYISFAGPLTYPRSEQIRQAAAFAPADRILVETDAPYLPPQDNRGETNEPAFITQTLMLLAELRKTSLSEMASQTYQNTKDLFGLS